MLCWYWDSFRGLLIGLFGWYWDSVCRLLVWLLLKFEQLWSFVNWIVVRQFSSFVDWVVVGQVSSFVGWFFVGIETELVVWRVLLVLRQFLSLFGLLCCLSPVFGRTLSVSFFGLWKITNKSFFLQCFVVYVRRNHSTKSSLNFKLRSSARRSFVNGESNWRWLPHRTRDIATYNDAQVTLGRPGELRSIITRSSVRPWTLWKVTANARSTLKL